MRVTKYFAFPIFAILFATLSSAIVINELVTDPQTDWDKSNSTGSGDEWIELFNPSNQTLNITNWTLIMNDSTPSTQQLADLIPPGKYKIVLNPEGVMNNDGQILLHDNLGQLIDSVTYGNWDDGNKSDNAPTGNSADYSDECLARIPNSQDTGIDSIDFKKVECTYGEENKIILPNEQNMEVTIAGGIVFQVFPRNLEFGLVQPDSEDNPALNGPIILNITGSTEDAQVEITDIVGSPFNQGLKLDDEPALYKIWTIFQSSPIVTAIPTLDVPQQTLPGNKKGTIVYTVTGLP
jgi:hypothetical protein